MSIREKKNEFLKTRNIYGYLFGFALLGTIASPCLFDRENVVTVVPYLCFFILLNVVLYLARRASANYRQACLDADARSRLETLPV
jgi:hypothetical protein